jgi:hypothetical protein
MDYAISGIVIFKQGIQVNSEKVVELGFHTRQRIQGLGFDDLAQAPHSNNTFLRHHSQHLLRYGSETVLHKLLQYRRALASAQVYLCPTRSRHSCLVPRSALCFQLLFADADANAIWTCSTIIQDVGNYYEHRIE